VVEGPDHVMHQKRWVWTENVGLLGSTMVDFLVF